LATSPTTPLRTSVEGVSAADSRKGNVVARVIETIGADALSGFVAEAVSDKVSLLVTDQWVG
jgi:hypothetical protein